jgi:hypothetical protein
METNCFTSRAAYSTTELNTKTMKSVLYAKDIMIILGVSERAARATISRVRKHYGKVPGQPITIEEFCAVKNIAPDQIPPLN